MNAVLEDWQTAPVSGKLRATLGFLEKLTLRPAEVGPEDVSPMLAAGVGEQAIVDAIRVCAAFNVIDRIADALGFEVLSEESNARAGGFLMRFGYF